MSSPPTPSHRGTRGLQDVSPRTAPSAEAATLTAVVMRGDPSVSRALELVAEHFAGQPRVDSVVAALTTFAPEDPDDWVHLGQRAWVREWVRPGSPCRAVPTGDRGPDAALTMPWMSQVLPHDVAVIPDSEDLPPEADQDRRELEACGARAVLGSAQNADGKMYGSLSVVSAEAGAWPETYVADLRLLSAALTSRMVAEQAQRSLADAIAVGDQAHVSQQQFFAAIGHELRTPISAIVGFAEVISEEAAELDAVTGLGDETTARLTRFAGRVGRDAAIILRAGEQLLDIVEELLRTGRVLADEEVRQAVSIAEAVQDVVHWLRTPARAQQVRISSEVPSDLTVWTSAMGVRQILTSLVSNGVAHNHVGGTVEIFATRTVGESGEARVRISVRDSGPGLTAEQQQGAFEPFVRYAGPGVRGTGLGLPLSRAVAERHGGALGVESTPGQGTTFWLDLPADEG